MSDEEVDIVKLRDVVRGNWKAIEKLKKVVADLVEKVSAGSGGAPPRKRYIEAKFSDSVQITNDVNPQWFGCTSGIEIDADVSGEELLKAMETQQKQVEFFVTKWMKGYAEKKEG